MVSTVKSVPADQRSLFKEFWETWADNIERRAFRMQMELTDGQKKTLFLLDLDSRLQSYKKQLSDFGVTVPSPEELREVHHIVSTEPAVVREEMDLELDSLQETVEDQVQIFTPQVPEHLPLG